MTTALAVKDGNGGAALPAPTMPDDSTMEKVLVEGNLASLNTKQRLAWYNSRCDAAGLDPRTQPFQYLSLQGKLTLYATKAASDQLIANRRLTVEVLDRTHHTDLGIYEVRCRVTFPDGHHVEDVAALYVKGLVGEALCNAYMKTVTKSKRRTVLSACGLGMLDETETETIPGASRVDAEMPAQAALDKPAFPQNNSGHGRGQYASPEQIRAYLDALDGWLAKKNAAWVDAWQDKETGFSDLADRDLPHWCVTPLNIHQCDGHLLKWCVETGRLDRSIVPEEAKVRQLGAYVAIVYHRSKDERIAVGREMERYAEEQCRRAKEAIYRKHPDLDPDASDGEPATEAEAETQET